MMIDLNKLKNAVNKDLFIDKDNIVNESLNNPIKQHKYSSMLISESLKLHNANLEKNKMFKKLFKYYKEDYDYNIENKDISKFIENDEDFINVSRKHKMQAEIVNYLERVVKSFEQRSYNINNVMKFLIWQNGGNY